MTTQQQAARDRAVEFMLRALEPLHESACGDHRRAVEQFVNDLVAACTPGQGEPVDTGEHLAGNGKPIDGYPRQQA